MVDNEVDSGVMSGEPLDAVELAKKIIDEGEEHPLQRFNKEMEKPTFIRVMDTLSSVMIILSRPIDKATFTVDGARELALMLRQSANRLEKRLRG